jgi:hypothetical protein
LAIIASLRRRNLSTSLKVAVPLRMALKALRMRKL